MSGDTTVTHAGSAELRSWGSVVGSLVIAAALSLLPLLEPVHRVLGVDVIDVAIAMGVFGIDMIAGAILYRRLPPGSRAFGVFDRIETALVQIAVLFLVYRSGRGDSFFWVLALVHIMFTGNYAAHVRFHFGLFCTLPAVLAVAFIVGERDLGAAVLSLMIGALGVYVYSVSVGVGRRLVAAEAGRLHADRQRIARDIHDGIGADLAALDWRLRSLRSESDVSPALRAEADALASRFAQSADELRTIVWALRAPERTWIDLVAYVRTRAAELAGGAIEVSVEASDDGGVASRPGELALDYVRSIVELVRNAVRHAGAKHIEIAMTSSATGLAATVTDDGRGVPASVLERSEGGLANLRHRTSQRGGAFVVAPSSARRGTRFDITFVA